MGSYCTKFSKKVYHCRTVVYPKVAHSVSKLCNRICSEIHSHNFTEHNSPPVTPSKRFTHSTCSTNNDVKITIRKNVNSPNKVNEVEIPQINSMAEQVEYDLKRTALNKIHPTQQNSTPKTDTDTEWDNIDSDDEYLKVGDGTII